MGSSGGGGAGKTEWPGYMQTQHATWLTAINTLIGTTSNPYTGVVPYAPATDLAAMMTAISTYTTTTAIATLAAGIDTLVSHFADAFYDHIYTSELPGIAAAVYAANLVQSSAYAIAQMLALQGATESAVRASIPLYASAASEFAGAGRVVLQATLDTKKATIIAKSEEAEKLIELDVHEATWPFDLYTYAGNMLAAIGGGHSGMGMPKPNRATSALGGAMAGAATGAAVTAGSPYGAIIGAVIGGVGGYMSAG